MLARRNGVNGESRNFQPQKNAKKTKMSFDRAGLARAVRELAQKGVYIGTSSWKYPGWCGTLYESARYDYRGKMAMTRFERNCLEEYAQVFKTVSVDAAFYKFPEPKFLDTIMRQVQDDFQFAFKVTDTITIKKFPNLPKFGMRAGEINHDFLNAELFAEAFLKTCEPFKSRVGLLMFEFGRFFKTDFPSVNEFSQTLDTFFSRLPNEWPYGIEIRNRDFLTSEYFGVLAKHRVTHVYNSWTDMPSVKDQMAMAGSVTNPNLVAARFLMTPGRKYDESLKLFQPYDRLREPDEEARQAGAALMVAGERYEPRRKTFVYVNNRLEGNALETIAAMIARAMTLLMQSRQVVKTQSDLTTPT
jgi:uncharacterized protein YecE (DUF72 family)